MPTVHVQLFKGRTADQKRAAAAASLAQHCWCALEAVGDPTLPAAGELYAEAQLGDDAIGKLRRRYNECLAAIGAEAQQLLREWPARLAGITAEKYTYQVRDKLVEGDNYRETLSHNRVPNVQFCDF
jgi:methylmalonyl-CoA mutase